MTEEDRSDSGTDDYYDDGEEVYDDEATLDEEEMLEGGEDYENELKVLEDDANLPVEELRRRYYRNGRVENECRSSVEDQSSSVLCSSVTKDISSGVSKTWEGKSSLNTVAEPGPSSTSDAEQKHESHGYFSDVEDTEEDTDYVPPNPWRRDVREGPGYQASVPESPSFQSPFAAQERGSLLWSPMCELSQEKIEYFLKEFYKLAFKNSESSKVADLSRCNGFDGRHPLKDDENALKALMDANYNIEEALLHYPYAKVNAPRISAPTVSSDWTEQLPHRTVGELAYFYYIWKKTERHDIFVEKAKVQERPNCTDFMGRLIGHMDATTGDTTGRLSETIEFSASTIPKNLDLLNTKAWGDCWQQQNDGSPLPHLDNDTIANLLQ